MATLTLFSEHRLGTSGPGQGGKRNGHEAHGRSANIRHAPAAQWQHVALPRRDAPGQGPVQVSGVVRGPADRRVTDHIPRHGVLPGHRLIRDRWPRTLRLDETKREEDRRATWLHAVASVSYLRALRRNILTLPLKYIPSYSTPKEIKRTVA